MLLNFCSPIGEDLKDFQVLVATESLMDKEEVVPETRLCTNEARHTIEERRTVEAPKFY